MQHAKLGGSSSSGGGRRRRSRGYQSFPAAAAAGSSDNMTIGYNKTGPDKLEPAFQKWLLLYLDTTYLAVVLLTDMLDSKQASKQADR